MASIVAFRTFNTEQILSVLTHPDILKSISENGSSNLQVNPQASCFIACTVDDELSAVFIFDKIGACVCDIHAHVLPAKRPHSKDIGAAILSHFFNDVAPWAAKLTAVIPVCFPNVIAYAHQFGFINEGVNRQSYLLQGDLIDQVYLGATKEEVLKWVG